MILLEEIDYILEGRNADRFRRDFSAYDWVQVPTVHWRFTSPRVVTLEFLPGAKISDVESHRARMPSRGKEKEEASPLPLLFSQLVLPARFRAQSFVACRRVQFRASQYAQLPHRVININ